MVNLSIIKEIIQWTKIVFLRNYLICNRSIYLNLVFTVLSIINLSIETVEIVEALPNLKFE